MATTEQPVAAPGQDAPHPPSNPQAAPEPSEKSHGHSALYWLLFAVAVTVAAILVFCFAWLPRHKQQQEINKQAEQQKDAIPRVRVIRIKQAPAESELMVPGTTQAYTEANIYARASGYVSRRLADIGDHVGRGQLLAIIDAPDLDKQVAQARSTIRQSESNLAQVQAQLRLATLTWDRYKVLVAKGVFSRQDGDTQEANFRVAEANVLSAQNTVQGNRDNLERLLVLQGYERVTAPFDGVITARNVDVGALITAQGNGAPAAAATAPGTTQSGAAGNNAGPSGNVSSSTMPSTGGTQGGAMFTIADLSRLRILISVPEAYTSVVKVGQKADLFFQEVPSDKFEGRVTRTSSAIDQNTRTLLVEVQVRNHGGKLLPGMYSQVNLIQSKSVPAVMIPGEAVVIRGGKTAVALVADNVVHYRPVTLGRDYGDQTEITSGLKSGDVVALNISDQVTDGAKIEPQFADAKNTAGGQSDKAAESQGQYGNQNLSNQGTQQSPAGGKKSGSGSSGSKKQ